MHDELRKSDQEFYIATAACFMQAIYQFSPYFFLIFFLRILELWMHYDSYDIHCIIILDTILTIHNLDDINHFITYLPVFFFFEGWKLVFGEQWRKIRFWKREFNSLQYIEKVACDNTVVYEGWDVADLLNPWKYFSRKSLWAGIWVLSFWRGIGSNFGAGYCSAVTFLIVTSYSEGNIF